MLYKIGDMLYKSGAALDKSGVALYSIKAVLYVLETVDGRCYSLQSPLRSKMQCWAARCLHATNNLKRRCSTGVKYITYSLFDVN